MKPDRLAAAAKGGILGAVVGWQLGSSQGWLPAQILIAALFAGAFGGFARWWVTL